MEESILEDVLSDSQVKKANILQQLSNITPSLWKIPDTNQPDIQLKIQQLTKQLEELKAKNPQLFFTIDDYLKQGDALFFQGRYQDAIISYDKVIKKQPDCYLAWVSRGWALRRLGRYEEALKSYQKAIDIKPEDSLGWYGKANALRELQQYDEAIIAYDKSLKFNPDFEWAWYRKARCYLVKGDIDKAVENLEKAIELNPDKLRQIARNDGDWDVIRNIDKFRKLIDE
jgi:tetratricopeptide (TPR) repeat protein